MAYQGRIVVTLSAAVLCTIALAGDPTPPAGPVAGTMKTLDDVEARIPINSVNTPGDADVTHRITQAGSYYLTENLIGEPGKVGLAIAASDVTVDLNGFAILGQGVGTTGISVTSGGMISLPQENVVVRNGHVRNWTGIGVFGAFIYGVLEDISIDSNGGAGLEVPLVGALQVRDCRITRNNGDGVLNDGFHTTLERCLIADNDGNGIVSNQNSLTLVRTRVVGNKLTGVLANAEAAIQDSYIMDNQTGWGIEAYGPTLVSDSVIAGNGWANEFYVTGGILLDSRTAVRDSHFSRNQGHDVEAFGNENFVADNFFGTELVWNTTTAGDYSSFFIRNYYRGGPDRILGQPLDPGIGQLLHPNNADTDDRPHSNYHGIAGDPGQ